MADQPFLNSGFQNFLNTAVPIGVRAKSSTSNLTPTPNTIGKGFVEPYSSVANTQYGNKSTENGTGGSSFMPKPPAPSVAQPPANPNARMTGQLNDLQSQLKAKQDQLAKQTAAGYTGNTQPQYDTQGNLVPFTQPNQGAGGTDQTKTSPYDYTQVIPGTNLTLPQLAAMMANRAQQPSSDYTAQQAHINDILSRKKALDTELAQQTANIEGTPGSLAMAGGQEGLLNRLYAGKSAALSGEYQGATNLLGAANTQQGLQQAGLGAAMGAVAPQPYGITTTPYNPAQGTFGTMPGGSNGAFGAGQVSGNVGLGEQYSQMNAANVAAKGYESTIKNYIAQNPQLNPSDLTLVNSIAQWLQGGQLGDPKYQTLANYLNEYTNTLAPILGVGGSVTDFKTGLAKSLINGQASGQNMIEVLDNISKAADDKLANMKSAGTGGGQVAGGSSGYNLPKNTGGNTFGGFFDKNE